MMAASTVLATTSFALAMVSPASATNSPYSYSAHGGVLLAYVTGADIGTTVTFTNSITHHATSGSADALGSFLARGLSSGTYSAASIVHGHATTSTIHVLSTASTPPSTFSVAQSMHAGLNYITMRDGVKLAATVRLPPGKTLRNGPFPTLIEYSGYDVAGPASLIDSLTGKPVPNPALLPSTSTIVGSFLAPELGFAVVSLQMRGTACSGGAFDLFGYDSDLDGYDAIQIVGHQSWVLHHKVGMIGISYSGISQFEVAGTRPPALAAIAPMSPTDDLYSTGSPGGIFNNGFAAGWIAERQNDSLPASMGGQPWAQAEIATGDLSCAANQALHLEAQSVSTGFGPGIQRDPSLYDQRSPSLWATHINVPVFVVGSLQDEQTGPQWASLISSLKSDPHVFATLDNGLHIDSLGPETITEWYEFLNLFVAGRTTNLAAVKNGYNALKFLEPLIMAGSTGGASEVPIDPLGFTTKTTLASAITAFESAQPRVHVLFNNGGTALGAGTLGPTGGAGFTSWPPAGTITRLYLNASGALGSLSSSASSVGFTPDPSARPATDLPSGNPWAEQPPYNWTAVTGSTGVGFVTAPFAHQTTVVGPASLDLWLKSSALDTDLQATISEVRSNGSEEYVASGDLRASWRHLRAGSTTLAPRPSFLTSNAAVLPSGVYSLVRIPIDPIGHVFPAGSKLRVTISAPGGDRVAWTFDTYATTGTVTDTISIGGLQPSSLAINVVSYSTVLAVPTCGALRGEPCRTYVAAGNGG